MVLSMMLSMWLSLLFLLLTILLTLVSTLLSLLLLLADDLLQLEPPLPVEHSHREHRRQSIISASNEKNPGHTKRLNRATNDDNEDISSFFFFVSIFPSIFCWLQMSVSAKNCLSSNRGCFANLVCSFLRVGWKCLRLPSTFIAIFESC